MRKRTQEQVRNAGRGGLRLARFLILSWLALPAGPALGAVAEAVVDGDTLVLAEAVEGAREVRLVGIQAPKLPLGRPDFQPWPLGEEAKAALEALVRGQVLTLEFHGGRKDRHGRLLAHLRTALGGWIQGEMLRLGMARVYSFPDHRTLVAEMLAFEREARAARRGLWSHPYYAVRTPETVANEVGTFQLVEGHVLESAKVKGTVFLNFGPDWRTDFTIAIGAKDMKRFGGMDSLALDRRSVRVRGWIHKRNGPLIEATHPEQIEVLE